MTATRTDDLATLIAQPTAANVPPAGHVVPDAEPIRTRRTDTHSPKNSNPDRIIVQTDWRASDDDPNGGSVKIDLDVTQATILRDALAAAIKGAK